MTAQPKVKQASNGNGKVPQPKPLTADDYVLARVLEMGRQGEAKTLLSTDFKGLENRLIKQAYERIEDRGEHISEHVLTAELREMGHSEDPLILHIATLLGLWFANAGDSFPALVNRVRRDSALRKLPESQSALLTASSVGDISLARHYQQKIGALLDSLDGRQADAANKDPWVAHNTEDLFKDDLEHRSSTQATLAKAG